MTDPKLVVTQQTWEGLPDKDKFQMTYDTIISTRENLIEINKKLDGLINQPESPCDKLEDRIKELEKWSKIKTIATIIGGFFGGFGGSQVPK